MTLPWDWSFQKRGTEAPSPFPRYRGGPELFDLYTEYMYEKIFGEPFVRKVTRAGLEPMRQRFNERYQNDVHCLIRLTEAQEEYFGELDARMPEYRAVTTPTLIMPGEQDRAIPLWGQKKMLESSREGQT